MKRISLLVLGLCAATWASGCCCWCHGYYSRYSDCDDGYVVNEGRQSRRYRRRHRDVGNGCAIGDGNCCDSSCCNGSIGAPMTYDGGSAAMNGGCANCGTTQQAFGGTVQNYGAMPFDPGAGWTVQSMTTTPAGNEPVMAPPSTPMTPATPVTPGPARVQGWAPTVNPAPASGPVPPPVSYNR